LKSKPFNLLPVCPRNNLGGGLNLKTFLSRFKDLSSKKKTKKNQEREKAGKKGGALGTLWKKQKNRGSLGKEFGQTQKDPLTAQKIKNLWHLEVIQAVSQSTG
jgi:hypothetical protein